MISCVLVHCHTPGIIFLNLLKMRSKKWDNLAVWGFSIDQQTQCWHLLASCVLWMPYPLWRQGYLERDRGISFPCIEEIWTTPCVFEMLLQNDKALMPPSKEMEMQRGVWSHMSHPNELMAKLEPKTCNFPCVSELLCSLSFELLGSLWVFEVIFERFVAGINELWDWKQ